MLLLPTYLPTYDDNLKYNETKTEKILLFQLTYVFPGFVTYAAIAMLLEHVQLLLTTFVVHIVFGMSGHDNDSSSTLCIAVYC